MSQQWLRLVALGSMVALAGCGSSSPAPVPSTVTVLPTNPVLVQLSGVVTDDDGAPVPGVTVFVSPWNGPAGPGVFGNAVTTVTDGSGRYSVTFNSVLAPGGGSPVPVYTEKSGYESSDYYGIGCGATNACRPDASTFALNLRIYRIRSVPVGRSTTIDVKRGDPECGGGDDVPFFCRAVRITGPPGATVALQASTNPSNTVAALTLDASAATCCPFSLAATANMPANGELRVYLQLSGYAPATTTFTFTSAILP
jgi:hypothetical protein